MEEFSPGKSLSAEKASHVGENSCRRSRLRADVRQKIKERLQLQRQKAVKETKVDNRTEIKLPAVHSEDHSLSSSNPNAPFNKGLKVAKVVEKLWRIKKQPHYHSKEFIYPARVPCFLRRNTTKVQIKKTASYHKRKKKKGARYNWQSGSLGKKQNNPKEFYFKIKHARKKRSACSTFEQNQAKRFCLESDHRKLDEQDVRNEDDTNTEIVTFNYDNSKEECISRNGTHVKGNRLRTRAFKAHRKKGNLEEKKCNASSYKSELIEKGVNKSVRDLFDCAVTEGFLQTETTSSRLGAKKNFLPSFIQTSTPKPKRIHTESPKIQIMWQVTPPESEVTCTSYTDVENSVFVKENDSPGSSVDTNSAANRIMYKPLFPNKLRMWKSVVIENDS